MILAALIGVAFIAIFIFQKTNNSSIALSEQWIVSDVADGDTLTVRQTDGSQMQVQLCGIDVPELIQGKPSTQALANEAFKKLRSLVATADNQVIIIPVRKDSEGRTIAEVMAYGKNDMEISFQEELLKNGLAKIHESGIKCPNHSTFEQAQKIAIASKAGMWKQSN